MSKPKSFVCPKDHGLLRKTTIGDVLGVGSGIAHVCGSCDGVWIEDAKAVRNPSLLRSRAIRDGLSMLAKADDRVRYVLPAF